MLKWIDIPPTWLIAMLVIAWNIGEYFTFGLSFGPVWADFLGGVMVGAGLLLFALAVWEMTRHRTTVIPHKDAAKLVTSGIFSRTRNPIYLGDSLILLGLILRWDAVMALPLVALFVWIIEKRFILTEEARLQRKFVAEYTRYTERTRRWL